MRRLLVVAAVAATAALAGLLFAQEAGKKVAGYEVFQDLDEATRRIPSAEAKPWKKLIKDGIYQSDVLIFRDAQTGAEIWSLTRGACTELANIERRCAWNCNGSRVGLIGNRPFPNPDGSFSASKWPGHNYIMHADLTNHMKLYANIDGRPAVLTGKFNIWDAKDPDVLYYIGYNEHWDTLWRVKLGKTFRDGVAEPWFKFPNDRRKYIQDISDTDLLCIQDNNAKSPEDPAPLYYIIDLNKKPSEAGFCRSHTLTYGGIQGVAGHDPKNEYRVHGITISRDGKRVSWGYGSSTEPGEPISFSVPSDDLNAKPVAWSEKMDPWGQYISHPDTGPDGKRAYFAGPTPKTNGGDWGLWIRWPGDKSPIYTGAKCPGGHVTWCGFDPDWYFANVSRDPKWKDPRFLGTIVRGSADGKVVSIICTPYDRRRGGKSDYDGIPRPNQSPDATKCWFHSSMLMPNDTFTGSYIAVNRRPYAPTDVTVKGGPGNVELSWKPHRISREVMGYNVWRGDGGTSKMQLLTDEPAAGTRFVDTTAAAGRGYVYIVTSVEWSGLESDESSKPVAFAGASAPSAPLKGWVKTPPEPVKSFKAARDADGDYLLAWDASPAKDLRYYNIYFSTEGTPKAEQKRRIASPAKGTASLIDWGVPQEGKPSYAITAVDRQGNESAPTAAQQ
jgi:hypothetical protein